MRIAIPQLNYHTGDIQKNQEIMLQAIRKARSEKADLIVFRNLPYADRWPAIGSNGKILLMHAGWP